MMEKSTLKKLSQILGISVSTVSRALKDHPDISTNTRNKVKELAAAMEYEPNSYAVQLRTRQSNVLGILVPSINNFFYDSFIATVEDEARRHGYSVLIMQSRDQLEIENATLNFFRKNMVMGLFAAITIATEDMSGFRKLEELGMPVMFIDRVPQIKGFYAVCMADNAAARIAAEAIIKQNKKHVLALFGHPQLSISKIRKDSFLETFQNNAPETKLSIQFPEQSEPSRQLVLEALTSPSPPDVIFCMGDMILIGAMKAIHQLNINVPETVSVIGISNGFIPGMYNPEVTYVETSGTKLGQLAFQQMLARLKHQPISEIVCVDSQLVKGGSL